MFQNLYWQDLFHLPVCFDETPLAPDVVTKCRVLDVIEIDAGQMAVYAFELRAGDTLAISLAASQPLELMICSFAAYEVWIESVDSQTTIDFLEESLAATSHSIRWRSASSQEVAVILSAPLPSVPALALFEATVTK